MLAEADGGKPARRRVRHPLGDGSGNGEIEAAVGQIAETARDVVEAEQASEIADRKDQRRPRPPDAQSPRGREVIGKRLACCDRTFEIVRAEPVDEVGPTIDLRAQEWRMPLGAVERVLQSSGRRGVHATALAIALFRGQHGGNFTYVKALTAP